MTLLSPQPNDLRSLRGRPASSSQPGTPMRAGQLVGDCRTVFNTALDRPGKAVSHQLSGHVADALPIITHSTASRISLRVSVCQDPTRCERLTEPLSVANEPSDGANRHVGISNRETGQVHRKTGGEADAFLR